MLFLLSYGQISGCLLLSKATTSCRLELGSLGTDYLCFFFEFYVGFVAGKMADGMLCFRRDFSKPWVIFKTDFLFNLNTLFVCSKDGCYCVEGLEVYVN